MILKNEGFGECRLALFESGRPIELIIHRDLNLNFGDVVTARITAFHPLLHGYFADTDRGAVFIPTDLSFNEGQSVCVQIVKEARPGKDATAHLTDKTIAAPIVKSDRDITSSEMDELIDEAMKSDVMLPEGFALHIERTSVCWTIDVDSGKCREALDIINRKMIPEIARQIRLKNMGGIILIDFAGSKRGKMKNQINDLCREVIKSDALARICGWTSAGLLEIERRRERADLWTSCACNNPTAVYYHVRRALSTCKSGNPIIRVAPEVLKLLQQVDIRAKLEPIFGQPVSYFEIEEL